MYDYILFVYFSKQGDFVKVNYIKHNIVNLINIKKIVTIHYYELDANFDFEGEMHDFWEMVYVDKGEVFIKTDNSEFTLKQGDIAFHKPNEFHTISASGKTTPDVFIISFVSTSEAMTYFQEMHTKVPEKLKSFVSAIINEAEKSFYMMPVYGNKLKLKENAPYGGQQMIKTYLEQFLIMLVRYEIIKSSNIFPTKESMETHLGQKITEYAKNTVNTKFCMNELCGKLNYSKAYLSRVFKEATSKTIGNYIIELKIKEAKKLIREGVYNFSEIADMLSFDNPQYFSKVFKSVAKMTPTEYKNLLRDVK